MFFLSHRPNIQALMKYQTVSRLSIYYDIYIIIIYFYPISAACFQLSYLYLHF